MPAKSLKGLVLNFRGPLMAKPEPDEQARKSEDAIGEKKELL